MPHEAASWEAGADSLPSLVTGSVVGAPGAGAGDAVSTENIAIFVNGKLCAVTRCLGSEAQVTDPRRPDQATAIHAPARSEGQVRRFFSALLPESCLVEGRNELEAFFVSGPQERPLLLRP